MKILRTVDEVRAFRRESSSLLGFVPTMGALHEGHCELIKRSAQKCAATIVSIFVNPTQFGPNEDFEKYPRTVDNDLRMCEQAGADAVFLPEKTTIYDSSDQIIKFSVGSGIASILCGKNRPGHFDGVVQVVSILFNIVQPDIAFFGEKDFQQLAIIRKMTGELRFPVEISSVPTVRESDGLAKSSRNRYLSKDERKSAANIFKVLEFVRQKAESARFDRLAIPVEFAESEAEKKLEMLVPGIRIDYFEIRNSSDLSKGRFLGKDSRVFVAAYIGSTRLIDNLFIGG
jgi:pantoate--beta-alanine ligase